MTASNACRWGFVLVLAWPAGALAAGSSAGDTVYSLQATYPAPSGVFRRIEVTSMTVLARDGGYVQIGNPLSPEDRLSISGGTVGMWMKFAPFKRNVLDLDRDTHMAAPPRPSGQPPIPGVLF